MTYPFTKTWWIEPGKLLGGQYPGTPKATEQEAMLEALLEAGVSFIVNLQRPDETGRGGKPFPDYMPAVRQLAAKRGIEVGFRRFAIPDTQTPEPAAMVEILDCIDAALAEGRTVYVHCWGGNGRTGTVAGCHLVRHGRSPRQALAEMAAGREGRKFSNSAPENDRQRDFVHAWPGHDPALNRPIEPTRKTDHPQAPTASLPALSPACRERAVASLLGLALGDALGTTVEFKPPGTFTPLTDIVGGGTFQLKPGQWTDDTSMALCLAESLIESGGFDPRDQMERYCRWWRDGHLSSVKGKCFDIGGTVSGSLRRFQQTGKPYAGPTAPDTAGNGALMRLAPVAIAYADRPTLAVALAGESSRTTHGTRESVDACRLAAALLVGLIRGQSTDEVLAPGYTPVPGLWQVESLAPTIAEIAAGAYKARQPPQIKGKGYVVASLEAALWAFDRTDTFRDAVLEAANLGDDADTTAAIAGQFAGACYGPEGLPANWTDMLTMRGLIADYAGTLTEFWDRP